MKFQSFLIKYAEIGIKGKNRYQFEDALVREIERALKKVEGEFSVFKTRGRVYVNAKDYDYEDTVSALKKVFGIAEICPVLQVPDEGFEKLAKDCVSYMRDVYGEKPLTFKVQARRSRKDYPKNSMQINADIGEAVLSAIPTASVDVHHPDVLLQIEVRENGISIYSEEIPGPGGMPVGTNGKAMLLLSGGIDSPVAGYMIAKRGVKIDAVYFHAPPYTSERAKQKVIDLAKGVAKYAGPISLSVVNFTEIQMEIYEKCPHDELTILMRRYMMRIAEILAEKNGCEGLITGESIGQVASQTIPALYTTNEVCTMPVFRPLIGFDKTEIITRAKEIGTYETSILPYEDCCTIFVAKHPVTKPHADVIRNSEKRLYGTIGDMVQKAVDTTEVILCE